MFLKRKYNPVIALLLLVLLLTPMLVQSLHRHSHGHPECGSNLPAGLNHAHAHKVHCEICSFEYVTALMEEPDVKEVFRPELNENMTGLPVSTPSLNIIYSPLRAPPAAL